TKTLENINVSGNFVLQLLSEDQFRLVDVLGKKSGHQIDKMAILNKRKILSDWRNFPILKNCISVMHLNIIDQMDAGDHHAMLCDVIAYKNITAGNPLTLDVLRAHKMIRI
ncbi:MAG: flavin reductase, partial [Ferruginibacter sp.]